MRPMGDPLAGTAMKQNSVRRILISVRPDEELVFVLCLHQTPTRIPVTGVGDYGYDVCFLGREVEGGDQHEGEKNEKGSVPLLFRASSRARSAAGLFEHVVERSSKP